MYASTWPGLSARLLVERERAGSFPFPFDRPDRRHSFFLARNAIYHLVRSLQLRAGEAILVPDYHHGVEVEAIRAAGARVLFYRIDRRVQPDLDAIRRLAASGARVLYVIHFLGWPQPMHELQRICLEHGLILIGDCGLALLSAPGGRPLGSTGDYSIFCLHKTLPLHNGGLLVDNGKAERRLQLPSQRSCGLPSLIARCAELSLEWLRGSSDTAASVGALLRAVKQRMGRAMSALGIERWPVGGSQLDARQLDLAMSKVSSWLIKRFDYQSIRERRRRNFARLSASLGVQAGLPSHLPEGVCPLFYPLLVKDKHAAALELWAAGVGAVELWNQGDLEAAAIPHSDARFLRRHLIELPIHQDLEPEQVDCIARAARRLETVFQGAPGLAV